MQLKIEINLPKDETPTPAPFDPVKIRNFVLLVIALLSIIGFGVYSMLTEDPIPTLPKTVNKEITLPTPTAEPNKTTDTTHTETANTVKNKEIDTITEARQSNAAINQSSQQEQTATLSNIKLETNNTEEVIAVIAPTSIDSPVIVNSSESPIQENNLDEQNITPKEQTQVKTETLSANRETPTIVNNNNLVTQKTTNIVSSNQPNITGIVRRAQLTSNIIDREPTDTIEQISLQEQNKLYLFTEIIGKSNQKVTHRWVFNQNIMAQVTLNIGSYQWRTYSSKNFDETMVGQWTVQVVDEDNNVLKTIEFEVLQ